MATAGKYFLVVQGGVGDFSLEVGVDVWVIFASGLVTFGNC